VPWAPASTAGSTGPLWPSPPSRPTFSPRVRTTGSVRAAAQTKGDPADAHVAPGSNSLQHPAVCVYIVHYLPERLQAVHHLTSPSLSTPVVASSVDVPMHSCLSIYVCLRVCPCACGYLSVCLCVCMQACCVWLSEEADLGKATEKREEGALPRRRPRHGQRRTHGRRLVRKRSSQAHLQPVRAPRLVPASMHGCMSACARPRGAGPR
jgi:hypothetical protein